MFNPDLIFMLEQRVLIATKCGLSVFCACLNCITDKRKTSGTVRETELFSALILQHMNVAGSVDQSLKYI